MADTGQRREDEDTDSEGPGCQCGRPLCAECFQQDDSDGPSCECGRPFCAECFQQDVDGEDSEDIGEEDENSEDSSDDSGEDSGEDHCHDQHQGYHYHHYDHRQQHFHFWQPPAYFHVPEVVHPAPITQHFATAAAPPPAQYAVLPAPQIMGPPPQYLTENDTDEEDDHLPYHPFAWEQRDEQLEVTSKKESKKEKASKR